jgi:hypothetical protein
MSSPFVRCIGLLWLTAPALASTAPQPVPVAPPPVVSVPAAADASRPALPDTPARRALAMQIARNAQPLDNLKFGAMKGFSDVLRMIAANEQTELGALEKRYPGTVDALLERVAPLLDKEVEKSAPGLWQAMSGVYVAELNDAEMKRVAAFFDSLTGRKMMRLIYQNADITTLADEVSEGGEVSVRSHVKLVEGAAAATSRSLTAEELAEVARFNADNHVALTRVAPKIMTAVTEWQNDIDGSGLEQQVATILADLLTERAAMEKSTQ